jgi:hypothetical protein
MPNVLYIAYINKVNPINAKNAGSGSPSFFLFRRKALAFGTSALADLRWTPVLTEAMRLLAPFGI